MKNNYNLLKNWAYKWAVDIKINNRTYVEFMNEVNSINKSLDKTIDCILIWTFLAYDEYLNHHFTKEMSINQLEEVYKIMKEGGLL